jgi:hypothetical protein
MRVKCRLCIGGLIECPLVDGACVSNKLPIHPGFENQPASEVNTSSSSSQAVRASRSTSFSKMVGSTALPRREIGGVIGGVIVSLSRREIIVVVVVSVTGRP